MSATSVACVQGAKKDGAPAQVMSAPIMQVIMEIADWTEKRKKKYQGIPILTVSGNITLHVKQKWL